MAQRLKAPKSLQVSNFIDVLFKIVIGGALLFLSFTVYEQREERVCFFNLNTETDKIDSDIATKQAEIFAVAIRSSSDSPNPSPELIELGQELESLIQQRDIAYARREDASGRCD